MGLPRDTTLTVSQHLLDQRAPDLYERFMQLAEKYQHRDAGRAVADALLYWVEAHEHSDTMRPPSVHDASPDATIPGAPPPSDPEKTGG
jgi:hypothetical protein